LIRNRFIFLALAAFGCALAARAQEMEPRSYSPSPIGMNFIAVAVGNSRGSVLFDPSLPITDVDANLNSASFGYARSIRIGSLQGQVAVGLPYVIGNIKGNVFEQAQQIRRSGLADLRLRMSLNLLGTKAMNREEFAKAPKRTILGVSLVVQAPTGQYDPTKLINLGTNRWSFKPEVGVSVPVGQWFLDAYLGAWFFTNNDEFYTGTSTRQQNPLTVLQAHASYVFKSRAWLAVDGVWYGGGASTVNSNPPSERQSNSRYGATFAAPITPRQSLKFAFSTGATTRTGTDFNSISVAWQLGFFDRQRSSH
jgi:hypothetical protein